jgi:hypothetical protein
VLPFSSAGVSLRLSGPAASTAVVPGVLSSVNSPGLTHAPAVGAMKIDRLSPQVQSKAGFSNLIRNSIWTMEFEPQIRPAEHMVGRDGGADGWAGAFGVGRGLAKKLPHYKLHALLLVIHSTQLSL